MATIYAYSSNSIYCTYSLSMTRSGSNVTVRAWGTIYGNGSSADSSGNNLYAHVCYNVSPANTGTATTYVSSYGTMVGTGKLVVGSPLNKSSIPTGGKAFDVSWTWANNAAISYSNCALFFSKSASSPSSFGSGSAGLAYSFIGKKSSDLSAAKLRYYTLSLSVAAGYTNVSNPTSVSISPAIVKPGGTVTVSWSGASGGTNNAIASYTVTLNGSSKTVTGSSTTFTNLTSRGTTYSATVKANPTVSGYGPSSGKTGGSCKVNTLPGTPTITINKSVVPSSGGTVRFTLSALGSNSDSGLTITCWYANNTSKSGEKLLTSYVDLTMNSSLKTIYFWCWDGLEYSSSYVYKTITINTKPTVSPGAMTFGSGTGRHSDKISTTAGDNYYIPSAISCPNATVTDTTATTTTYKWDLCYTAGTTTFNSSSFTVAKSSISTDQKPSGLDLRSLLPFNCAYKLRFTVNDGYEDSSAVFTTNLGVIPPKPVFDSDIFNGNATKSDVTGSVHKHFHDYLTTGFTKDTGVSISSIKIGSTDVPSTKREIVNNNLLNLSGLSSITTTRSSYTLSITFASAATTKETITASYTGLVRDGAPWDNLDGITISPATIKGYTNTYPIVITIPNLGGDYATISGNNNVKVYLVNGSDSILLTSTWSSTTTGAKLTLPNNFYSLSTNPLNINLESSNTLSLQIKFINVFTNTEYPLTKTSAFVIDCNEPFKDTSNLSMLINGNSINPLVTTTVYEKDIIRYNFNWLAYNAKTAQIETYIYRSDEPANNLSSIASSYWQKYPNDTLYKTTFSTGSSSASLKSGTKTINITAGVITESKYVYFKIRAGFVGETITNYFYESGNPPTIRTQRLVNINPLSFKIAEYLSNLLSWSHNSYNTGGGLKGESLSVGGLTSCNFLFLVTPVNEPFTTNSLYVLNDGSLGYKYILTTNEPGDWNENYTSYYTHDNVTDTFNSVTTYTNWVANTFYKINNLDSSENTGIKTITILLNNLATEEQKTTLQSSITFKQESWTIDQIKYNYLNIRLVGSVNAGTIDLQLLTEEIKLTKITYGEVYLIFDFGPTVSYRKNLLGINVRPEERTSSGTDSPSGDNSVLLISMADSTHKYLVLYGVSNNLETVHTINLEDGKIQGFVIDGGEWS